MKSPLIHSFDLTSPTCHLKVKVYHLKGEDNDAFGRRIEAELKIGQHRLAQLS